MGMDVFMGLCMCVRVWCRAVDTAFYSFGDRSWHGCVVV